VKKYAVHSATEFYDELLSLVFLHIISSFCQTTIIYARNATEGVTLGGEIMHILFLKMFYYEMCTAL
jgi:hypothetical protein